MESKKNMSLRHQHILRALSNLPHKMLLEHHDDRLAERVLYDLAHPDCFNFTKAAYFIENPDFNCIKGVVGFSRDDHKSQEHNHWDNPEAFHQVMNESSFHKAVRSCLSVADRKPEQLADVLHLKNPHSYTWKTKHGNHGILLFEHDHPAMKDEYCQELLLGLSLLGFCPTL